MLAGVSTEWYTRLEKGHIAGVSDDVLGAVADALRMNDDERAHLFDLARAARPVHHRDSRRRETPMAPRVQWMLDSVTMSGAFVRNGRLDIVAANPLARVLHQPLFDSPTAVNGVANFGRYFFLDEGSRDYFGEWEQGAAATVALLRAEAGREPQDRRLRELVGELTTHSRDFAELWASHDIRSHHDGTKTLVHPVVGAMNLTYQSMELPVGRGWQELTFYTAEPGSADEGRMRLLASWAAPEPAADQARCVETSDH